MRQLSWPSSVSLSADMYAHFDELAESRLHGSGDYGKTAPVTLIMRGSGRSVHEITSSTSPKVVLKVADNEIGRGEIRFEANFRPRVSQPLRSRLAPILEHDDEYRWCIQPWCRDLTASTDGAVERLSERVERAGYSAGEVTQMNMGEWNSEAVIVDYGGL